MMGLKMAKPRPQTPPGASAPPVVEEQSSSEEGTHRAGAHEGGISSLHGAKAALRHAITELLFFASIGDLLRFQRICQDFNVDVGPCCAERSSPALRCTDA